jgi:hypothetical protein
LSHNAGSDEEGENKLVAFEQTTGDVGVDLPSDDIDQRNEARFQIWLLLSGVDGLVEQHFDVLERVLVHVVDASHVCNNEIEHGTTNSYIGVSGTGLINFFFDDRGLRNTNVNF